MEFSFKSILESILVGVAATLAGMLLYGIPIVNLLLLLWPAPFILLGLKRGPAYGVLSAVLTGGIICFFDLYLGLISFVFIIFPVLLFILAIKQRFKSFECVALGAFAGLISVLLTFKVLSHAVGQNFLEYLWETIRNFFVNGKLDFGSILEMYYQAGLIKDPLTDVQLAEMVIEQLKLLIPGMILVFSVVYSGLNFLVVRWIGGRTLKIAVPYVPSFGNWALPRGMGRGFVAILFISMLGTNSGWGGFVYVFAALFMLFHFLFGLQGFAVVEFFLRAFRIPAALRVLILAVAFFFFQVMTVIGVAEQIFGLRRAYNNRIRWV